MVDNRGITPINSTYFKSGDASGMANKMSEEKYGQGGEYFASEMAEENIEQQENFQDRSAQLRASLNGLAMANAGSMMLMKNLKDKDKIKKDKLNFKNENEVKEEIEEGIEEYLLDE